MIALVVLDVNILRDRSHWRSSRYESVLHPIVALAPWIRCCSDIASCAWAVRSASRIQIGVLVILEVGKLIESDEVISLSLIIDSVLLMIHGAEHDLGS